MLERMGKYLISLKSVQSVLHKPKIINHLTHNSSSITIDIHVYPLVLRTIAYLVCNPIIYD